MSRPLLTKDGFNALCSRHNFSQAEKGTHALLNEILLEALGSVVKQGMLQADYQGQSGLSREHAQKAIENTPEIPKGYY